MKNIWLVLVAALILAGPVTGGQTELNGENKFEEKTVPGKDIRVLGNEEFFKQMSYSLGYDILGHLSSQVDLDVEAFLEGIQDGQKKEPKLDEAQMRQMLAAYQRLARKNAKEKALKIRDKNLARGRVFAEGNKLKQGVVSLPSGLQYKVLSRGDGPVPGLEDRVKCHYRGTLVDGIEFDSSYNRGQPTVFQVSRVIPGWTQALTLMPVGSKWELYIPPDLAYGDEGAGDLIQPGHSLIFELELLGILD